MILFSQPLTEIKGIGPKFSEKMKRFGLITVKDLLWHFPFRYEDFSKISKIADVAIGEYATIQGEVKAVKLYRTWKKKMFILEALVSDETGSIRAVWFNQKFLVSSIKKGKIMNFAGKIGEADKGGLIISHPVFEEVTYAKEVNDDFRHTGRVVPIYPETKGLTSKLFRYINKPILDHLGEVEDFLPEKIRKKYGFWDLKRALYAVHYPDSIEDALDAKKRFAFEDLFFLQMVNLRQRMKLSREKAYALEVDLEEIKEHLTGLPFELTQSQKKVLWDILKDFEKGHPMNRLLQGDVGSGKTIVAVLGAVILAKRGKQVAFMAPTEVLIQQHYNTFKKFFKDFDNGAAILTSSGARLFFGDSLEKEVKKTDVVNGAANGDLKIVFGTHALIQKYVRFKDLAFVVIDEQHRFGVKQRQALLRGDGSASLPHLLSMSATPIPRTLSLAVFGDLDLSIIDELPKGRKEIITKVVAPENRDKAYALIRGQIKKGRQAFVICPRIEKSNPEEDEEKLLARKRNYFWEDVRAVKDEYEKLSKKVFPDLQVGMLHGKLKPAEKNEIMNKFKENEIQLLVSTSVVEVGVDVPNATIMMIEGSDRFGLAQLYQFRGRVGRGEHQSFCFLFTDLKSKTVFERLNSLIEARNGFELAEKDLALRGPGEFLGESQTGVPDLAMKAVKNPRLLKDAREAAEKIMSEDPGLSEYTLLKERLDGFQMDVHLE